MPKCCLFQYFFFSLAGILYSGGWSFDWANVVCRLFHSERSLHAYWFSAVIAGRYDLPSYERAFSLTSYETESSSLQLSKGFRLFDFLQSVSWIWIIISDFSFVRECDGLQASLPAPNAFFLLLFFALYPLSACLFTNLPFQLDNH